MIPQTGLEKAFFKEVFGLILRKEGLLIIATIQYVVDRARIFNS